MSAPNQPSTLEEFQQFAAEVDRAIAAADGLAPEARAAALQLKSALERFHKVGLSLIVSRLRGDARGKELLFELVDEPQVRALLSLHGLIRTPPGEPEQARAAPAPAPPVPSSPLIPLGSLKRRQSPDWTVGPALSEIAEDRPFRLDAANTSVVLLRVGGEVHAFRNECAHQGLPIDGGRIDRESATITCPWHGFRFDCATGECLTAPHVQLERVPARVQDGLVHVQLT